eukprot:gene9298-1566_t
MSNPITRAFMRLIAQEKASQPSWLRFPSDVATRSPPPPNIPGGPAHKIHHNSYYARDYRRQPLRVFAFVTFILSSSEAHLQQYFLCIVTTRFGNTDHTPLIPEKPTNPSLSEGTGSP